MTLAADRRLADNVISPVMTLLTIKFVAFALTGSAVDIHVGSGASPRVASLYTVKYKSCSGTQTQTSIKANSSRRRVRATFSAFDCVATDVSDTICTIVISHDVGILTFKVSW